TSASLTCKHSSAEYTDGLSYKQRWCQSFRLPGAAWRLDSNSSDCLELWIMGQHCEICQKAPVRGNQVAQRGKAKYLGGNGRKTTGITRRSFRPNLQRIHVQEGAQVMVRRV